MEVAWVSFTDQSSLFGPIFELRRTEDLYIILRLRNVRERGKPADLTELGKVGLKDPLLKFHHLPVLFFCDL